MQNATVTIQRNPVEYDNETGDRKLKVEPENIVDELPCFFDPSRGSRRVFADTLRNSVKLVPSFTMDDPGEIDIRVGDIAFVSWQGLTKEYTIGHALITQGITFRKWYVELETVQVPAP